jgi:hypothetical protein
MTRASTLFCRPQCRAPSSQMSEAADAIGATPNVTSATILEASGGSVLSSDYFYMTEHGIAGGLHGQWGTDYLVCFYATIVFCFLLGYVLEHAVKALLIKGAAIEV